jgi:hypothetical protein
MAQRLHSVCISRFNFTKENIMLRGTILTLAAASLIGCSSSMNLDPTGDKQEATQMAAFAATAKHPTTAPANDWQVASMISGNTLKIINYSNNIVTDPVVWINGLYVSKVGTIAANATVTVPFAHFYDANGDVLNTDKTPVKDVVIENGSATHMLLGPSVEQ